jgi:hypothetical protein
MVAAFFSRLRNYLIAERTTDTRATKIFWNEHSLHLANPGRNFLLGIVVANPPGHMSSRGVASTGLIPVGGSADWYARGVGKAAARETKTQYRSAERLAGISPVVTGGPAAQSGYNKPQSSALNGYRYYSPESSFRRRSSSSL